MPTIIRKLKMRTEKVCDLILDMVNNGELVMKDDRIYAPEYAPKEGVYIPPNKVKNKLNNKTTEGN